MQNWTLTYSYQPVKPLDFEFSDDFVLQRRNIQRGFEVDEVSGENFDFWFFEQRALTIDEFNTLKDSLRDDDITQLQLALTEIYEKFLED